jgi:hypothetical protein
MRAEGSNRPRQEVGYETQTDTDIVGKLFMQLGLFCENAPETVNFTEPRGIVCLLKYGWQHFLRVLMEPCVERQIEDRKTAKKSR